MKSLFLLIDEAKQKYYSSNAEFQNKVDVMLSMLRSVGAVPYRRKKLNGHVHKLISATLVHAYESNETIRMTTRMLATCLLYTSPSPRDATLSRMPSSA